MFVLLMKVSKDILTNTTTRISLGFGFTKLQCFLILADFVLYQPINGHLQLNSLIQCVGLRVLVAGANFRSTRAIIESNSVICHEGIRGINEISFDSNMIITTTDGFDDFGTWDRRLLENQCCHCLKKCRGAEKKSLLLVRTNQ